MIISPRSDGSAAQYPFDLGNWSRPVIANPTARLWFDRGLNWVYGYNHEEAVCCFQQALDSDPSCAMAWWGIAYAAGPFYNRPWIRFSDAEIKNALPICFDAARRAQALASNQRPVDQALINAIGRRYQAPDEMSRDILELWHWQFTDVMRTVYQSFPDDLDVAALFAEAAVTCTPRKLWNLQTGEPDPAALTNECLPLLERAAEQCSHAGTSHPGILHMTIHTLEMSPFPERALAAADTLRHHATEAGHLAHMPGHIDVLCGDYSRAVDQSRLAVTLDDKYLNHAGAENFYTTSRCHDLHLYMYAAMFLGQFRSALDAADRICAMATPELTESSVPFMAAILDGYAAMRTHVLVRFGQWHELTTDPPALRPELSPIKMAMRAYGRAVGHANLGQTDRAIDAQSEFCERRADFGDDHVFLSNPVATMLGVGEAMMAGEIAYHRGDHDTAFDHLREAVHRDDSLNYTEPWAWMHPPRHALGALLAEQGNMDEAEAAFRQDLGYDKTVPRCCVHPDNVWALTGLVECVAMRGEQEEIGLLRQRLQLAQARTDFQISSACCCRQSSAQAS